MKSGIWILLLGLGSFSSFAITPELVRTPIEIGSNPTLEGVLVTAKGKRQPAVVLLGGFETGKKAVDLVRDQPGFAFASLDYPYKQDEKWTFGVVLKRGKELRHALHATREALCPFLDRVRADPGVDPASIIVLGASFGGPFALEAARDCRPVRALILVHAFGDIPGALAYRMLPRFTQNYGSFFGTLLAKVSGRLAWWILGFPSPEKLAESLPRDLPVLWMEAKGDEMIPESSRASLRESLARNRAGESRPGLETQWMEGKHLHPGDTEMIRDIVRRSREWLVAKGIISGG